MYQALVYSVPGSGTLFARRFIEEALGYEWVPYQKLIVWPGLHVCTSTHVYDAAALKMFDRAGLKTIVPLRRPRDTYLSRCQTFGTTVAAMGHSVRHWRSLIDSIDRFDHVLLPIDTEDRFDTLLRVMDHLDATVEDNNSMDHYVNDWPKVNSRPRKNSNHALTEFSFLSFADDWYEQQIESYGRAEQCQIAR